MCTVDNNIQTLVAKVDLVQTYHKGTDTAGKGDRCTWSHTHIRVTVVSKCYASCVVSKKPVCVAVLLYIPEWIVKLVL